MDDDTTPGTTAVDRYFFSPIYYPRNGLALLRWWESRRLFYNVVVGSAGLVTLATAYSMVLIFGTHNGPPLGLPFAYGLAANIFYSMGAPIDFVLRKFLGDRAPAVGQAMFRYGVAFSVGLTLLPIPLLIFGSLMEWLTH